MTYLLSFRRFTEILLGTLDFSSSRNDKHAAIPAHAFNPIDTREINLAFRAIFQ